MSISYSGIRGMSEKYTLQDVEGWNGSMNIIKEPKKGIVVPRRDKVGFNSDLTQEIEDSYSRIHEVINVYPRGVNLAVGVQFNNTDGGKQAYLPFRIMKDGAFRPPIQTQMDLLPLSRMPHGNISCELNQKGGYNKNNDTIHSPDRLREIKNEIIRTSLEIDPNAHFQKRESLNQTLKNHHNKSIVIQNHTIDYTPNKSGIERNIEKGLNTNSIIKPTLHSAITLLKLKTNDLRNPIESVYTNLKELNKSNYEGIDYIKPSYSTENITKSLKFRTQPISMDSEYLSPSRGNITK